MTERPFHRLDDRFRTAKKTAAARRRKLATRVWMLRIGLLALLGLIVFVGFNFDQIRQVLIPTTARPPEEQAVAPDTYVPAIVDLAGDPLIISLGDGAARAETLKTIPAPEGLPADRPGGTVTLLTDTMVAASQRFMTTLPSSPEDFAFYQSVGAQGPASTPAAPPADAAASGPGATAGSPGETGPAMEAGWGARLDGETTATATVAPAIVEDSTTTLTVRTDDDRFNPGSDIVLRVLVERDIPSLATEAPLATDDLAAFGTALKGLLGREQLEPGDVVAVHAVRQDSLTPTLAVKQMSLISAKGYVGTLSRSDRGDVVIGADPWVGVDLTAQGNAGELAQPGRQYRLLDAIYSTAVRNGVPTGVLGEAIMLMSRNFDLNAFASPEDKLVLAFGNEQAAEGGGRVLYASVRGPERDLECFVFKNPADPDYSCFTENSLGQSVTAPLGMTTPVAGVLTSTFGPRMHPIFKEVRVHTGIDWAAPLGTPVVAAFAGKVESAGLGGGYGNLLRIVHPDGRETYYAHLKDFAPGIEAGAEVAAGALVGHVGTTGNSTGPHLHFELRLAGTPIDPLQTEIQRAEGITSDDSAIDKLTHRIIAVESAGNPNAQNSLSSATGLGQFISTTWLRMVRTYRPDLANAMSEAELLALRTDPTLSEEMVRNLAREGEAYLKARGDVVTAGNLYLCHFLGMEDAHRTLSADPALPLEQFLAPGVIQSNPFLTGMTVAGVIAWADRKMSGPGVARPSTTAAKPAPSAAFVAYREAIETMLSQPATTVN